MPNRLPLTVNSPARPENIRSQKSKSGQQLHKRRSRRTASNAPVSLVSVLLNWAGLVALWALPYLTLLDHLRLDAARSEISAMVAARRRRPRTRQRSLHGVEGNARSRMARAHGLPLRKRPTARTPKTSPDQIAQGSVNDRFFERYRRQHAAAVLDIGSFKLSGSTSCCRATTQS